MGTDKKSLGTMARRPSDVCTLIYPGYVGLVFVRIGDVEVGEAGGLVCVSWLSVVGVDSVVVAAPALLAASSSLLKHTTSLVNRNGIRGRWNVSADGSGGADGSV